MKKSLFIIALAGLMTLAACNKQQENQGKAVFTATTEHQGGRTSLNPNNGDITWTAGDQIVIANDNDETAIFTLQSGEGTTEGGFGTSGEFNTVGPFIAAYPSDAVIGYDKVTFNLPATQAIESTETFANGANPMVACSDDKNLLFKSLCGGLGIRLKGVGAHVTAVRITSKNTAEKLWGAYEVSDCAAAEPTLTVASGNQGSNVITLTCDVTLTTAAKTFFVMLPPGTLANGFTMEVLDGEQVLVTKETTSDIALVERNSVKCFNEILIDVEFDGNVEIPTGMSGSDIVVTNFGEDAIPDENGDFAIGYSQILTAKNMTNNEVVYMSVVSVDYEAANAKSQPQNYELNAKETALYYALTMIPFGLNQAKDETFNSIKESLYTLGSVTALESAIEQSVNQYGYLRPEDIGDELNALWINLRDELLAPFLERQSSNAANNTGHIALKKDGTARLEQPQIQPNGGRFRGIRLDIESASFNESSNTWTLNMTGYSENGVFIGINKGNIVGSQAYPTGGRTPYFVPPMNVGKFMGTFTSFDGLKAYFTDTWRLFFEDGFGFSDMTWDMAKMENISFELASNENALIMFSPKDDQPTAVVNGVYAVMQVVGMALDDILTTNGYSAFFTSLFSNQELCASLAGLVGHPENFSTVANALLDWTADLFITTVFQQYINPKYNLDKILDKVVSSTARAAVEYVGNGLGTLASWYLFDSFAFTVDAEYNELPPVQYNVSVSSDPTNGGTVNGGGTYDQGQSCTVMATANTGYTFTNWTENGTAVSTNANYTFTVSGDRTLVANFTANGGGGGGGSGNHEYVDLGLPSGLLWATCNVGADAPEEYGDYFAWGETQPKEVYTEDTYTYNDNPTILPPENDAATANWGNGWRMPTMQEFQELCNNTSCTWTQQNGVNGRLFTASNGNSLFLPAAGCRSGSSLYDAGSWSDYWSSSLYTKYPNRARALEFSPSNCNVFSSARYFGVSVRAVRSAQ